MKPENVQFTIHGEPASKANSRRLVMHNGVSRSIKSKKALSYSKMFARQCPVLDEPLTEDVQVNITIHYASRRPDLDESLILDLMQGRIYKNDRQVKRKVITWGLDRENPRSEITVQPMTEPVPGQGS